MNDTTGMVLTADELSTEDMPTLKEWLAPIVDAVSVHLLVSDDADTFEVAADYLGLEHQACQGHVQRDTEASIESLEPKIAYGKGGSLATKIALHRFCIWLNEQLGRLKLAFADLLTWHAILHQTRIQKG